MSKTIFRACLVLTLALTLGAGCAQNSNQKQTAEAQKNTEPIAIGWLGPLSGDAASLGQDALIATQMAVEEINASGGINGRPLNLIIEDGKCSAKDSALAGNKLITVDKTLVVLGGACSGETMAVAPIAKANRAILFSYCSTAPNVTAAGDFVFRSSPSDALQGKFAAEYAYTKLGKRRVAVLAVNNDWGLGLKGSFTKNFMALGGTVALTEDYEQNTKDLRTQLTKIKQAGPDLIYFLGYTEASVAGLRQAKELGIDTTMLGGDPWDDQAVYSQSFADGIRYTVGTGARYNQAWANALIAKGGHTTLCAPRAYDNVKIVADIMRAVGTDTSAVKAALYKIKNYAGVGGAVTIDENGDNTNAEFDVKEVKNGVARVITKK